MSFTKNIDIKWLIVSAALWLSSILILILNQSGNQLEANIENIKSDIAKAVTDINLKLGPNELINSKLSDNSYSFDEFVDLAEEDYILLIFKNNELIFWNDNSVELDKASINHWKDDSFYKLNNGYYYYTSSSPDLTKYSYDNYHIAILYLLKYDYSIAKNNDYFKNKANPNLPIPENMEFSDELPYGEVRTLPLNKAGQQPVYAYFDTEFSSSKNYWVVFLLQLLSVFFLLYVVVAFSVKQFSSNRLLGFGFISLFCLFLFFMIIGLNFPIIFSKIPLFNRTIHPDYMYLRISLGKILLLVMFVFILLVYIFRYIKLETFAKLDETRSMLLYGFTTFVFSLFVAGINGFASMIIKSEETSLFLVDLINLNSFTFFGIVGLLMIIGIQLFSSIWIIRFFNGVQLEPFKRVISFMVGVLPLAFLLLSSINSIELNFAFFHTLFVCLALPLFKFPLVKEWRLQPILIVLVISSLVGTLFISQINNRTEKVNRENHATELSKEEVKVTPLQMKGVMELISGDKIYRNYYANPLLSFNELKSRILIRYFTEESFDILQPEIQFFDTNDYPMLHNSVIKNYEDVATLMENAKSTDIQNLWQIDSPTGEIKYLAEIEVPYELNTGKIIIEFTPENMEQPSDALPAEYGDEFQDELPVKKYDHAIYSGNILVDFEGGYPYSQEKDIFYSEPIKEDMTYVNINNYSHLIHKPNEDRTIVVSKRNSGFFTFVSIFSIIFFVSVCAVIIGVLLMSLLQNKKTKSFANDLFYSSMRKRISTTFFVIILFSFFLVGIVTTLYFSSRFNNETHERLVDKRTELIETITYEYKDKDSSEFEALRNNASLNKYLNDLSSIHDIYINIYDLNGRLIASSINYVFKEGLISRWMNPNAFQTYDKKKQDFFVVDEKISTLDYKAAYGTLSNKFGNPIGYIHLPFFDSNKAKNANISNFLSTIFNAYVFILLLSSLLALYLTRSITKPLQIIGQKINNIRLGSKNEELVWDDEDEIGELVNKYNEAVKKLESSAKTMAESERQMAYEQMAKQVSHEIKNPLTPMKLSIQQLQRISENNDPQLKDHVKRMCKTLIEQIDHLERVATEFSFFSRTKDEKRELLDLLTILNSVIFLYKETKAVKIVKIFPDSTFFVLADRTQLTKVFHNILKNAMQAVRHRDQGIIFVNVKIEEQNSVLVTFTDNGVGIPPEGVEKVFQPNFTTKTAGMGLGLAICRSIIEDISGEIWLESKLDEGTTFYIRIPLSR